MLPFCCPQCKGGRDLVLVLLQIWTEGLLPRLFDRLLAWKQSDCMLNGPHSGCIHGANASWRYGDFQKMGHFQEIVRGHRCFRQLDSLVPSQSDINSSQETLNSRRTRVNLKKEIDREEFTSFIALKLQ
jgi:hypothetical protein